MRMLLRVSIPAEAGNAAKVGTLGSTVEKILADLKPEAAYFSAADAGNRPGSIVFDMKDTSQIPAIAEPRFLAFSAKVSFRPVMNPQDLAAAGPGIAAAVRAIVDDSVEPAVVVTAYRTTKIEKYWERP